MPTIRQEGRVKAVKGLPLRWGVKAYNELVAARGNVLAGSVPENYKRLSTLLDEVTDAPLPLDATDSQICIKAQQWAEECYRYTESTHDTAALRRIMGMLCERKGIDAPDIENDRQFVARCIDPAWWRRQLRKVHGRKFEHAAIRLGFVSSRTGPYASDEAVKQRIQQNRRNARVLHSTILKNDCDQEFRLSELVEKSTSNKAIRRGELMLRIKGFETIAKECGHDGLFVTLTCPSKYHGVLEKSGARNPKYQDDLTPNDGQLYLRKVWARIRAALARVGVALYGFRIAEPHHDGCPHWHMLLFVQPFSRSRSWALSRVKRLFKRYAWAEDRGEPGCFARRVELMDIDWSKGDAAGYIAKYVGKNIDDEHVGEHYADGETVGVDLAGDEVIKPCQRVEAWAARWGIRQFQQIGGAPVTVWRELRRVKTETLKRSPAYLQEAWNAAQKTETKAACFATYLRAQGGVAVGRDYRVRIAQRESEIRGRYGLAMGVKPVGVFAVTEPHAVYESTRYQWSRAGREAAIDFPWTRVNNCTQPYWVADAKPDDEPPIFNHAEWFESDEWADLQQWMKEGCPDVRKNQTSADALRAGAAS